MKVVTKKLIVSHPNKMGGKKTYGKVKIKTPPRGFVKKKPVPVRPNAKAPLGSGGRFAAMKQKVGSAKLAAYIGRKKYGAKKMGQMAAAGKRRRA